MDKNSPATEPEVIIAPVAPAPVADGTTTLDFGKSGQLTGVLLLGTSSYGPNGEEVSALIPVGDDYVQVIVPARLVVK